MPLLVSISRHPAYWVLTSGVSAGASDTILPMSALWDNPRNVLGQLRGLEADSYERVISELLGLLGDMPGVPLGLTFDGGIAITATDYRLAESRWERASQIRNEFGTFCSGSSSVSD